MDDRSTPPIPAAIVSAIEEDLSQRKVSLEGLGPGDPTSAQLRGDDGNYVATVRSAEGSRMMIVYTASRREDGWDVTYERTIQK